MLPSVIKYALFTSTLFCRDLSFTIRELLPEHVPDSDDLRTEFSVLAVSIPKEVVCITGAYSWYTSSKFIFRVYKRSTDRRITPRISIYRIKAQVVCVSVQFNSLVNLKDRQNYVYLS